MKALLRERCGVTQEKEEERISTCCPENKFSTKELMRILTEPSQPLLGIPMVVR